MTTSKSQETAIILKGDPILSKADASEAIVPGLLLDEIGDGTIEALDDAEAWEGCIALPKGELGQGYSGVFATDSVLANKYASGDEVRYAQMDTAMDFHAWADGGSADIVKGDILEAVIGAGGFQGCVQKQAAGKGVAIALEAIAMTGIAVDTPIKVRRIIEL